MAKLQALEVGEAVGDDKDVVVGESVEVCAREGRQGVAHTSAAAEEAHGVPREARLAREAEGLEWEGRGGELSDKGVEVWVAVTEVEGLEVGEAGVEVGGWERDGGDGGGDGEGGAEVVGHGVEPLAHQGHGSEVAVVVEATQDGLPTVVRQISPRPPALLHFSHCLCGHAGSKELGSDIFFILK